MKTRKLVRNGMHTKIQLLCLSESSWMFSTPNLASPVHLSCPHAAVVMMIIVFVSFLYVSFRSVLFRFALFRFVLIRVFLCHKRIMRPGLPLELNEIEDEVCVCFLTSSFF